MSSRPTVSPLAVGFTQAAEAMSLSKNTLRRLAKTGRLATVRVGRRRLIPVKALRQLLREGNAQIPASPTEV